MPTVNTAGTNTETYLKLDKFTLPEKTQKHTTHQI